MGFSVLPLSDDANRRLNDIFMWGEVVDATMVVDLVGFLHQSRRTSVLTVVDGTVRKSIYFRDGSITAASSNQPEDRFGDIMFRRGMISRDQLDIALHRVGPGRKIGNVLLDQGLITGGDLWKIIRIQIEEIVYSVLLIEAGQYTVATYDPSQVPTSTPLETQHLLLEGLRRKDEMLHLREELPAAERVLAQTGYLTPSVQLDMAEQTTYALVDGRRTVGEVLKASGLGDFVATRALHRLLRTGLVGEAVALDPGEAGGGGSSVGAIVSGYNEAFARMHAMLASTPRGRNYQGGLASFFADADEQVAALFAGVQPIAGGRLPLEPIYANLKTLQGDDKIRSLRRGLREYLRFLLFVARECLPFDQVERLATEVRTQVQGL